MAPLAVDTFTCPGCGYVSVQRSGVKEVMHRCPVRKALVTFKRLKG